jgi:hypothetical protein
MATHASPKDLLTLANALDGTDSFPIAGAAALSSTLAVTGAATFASTCAVTGALTGKQKTQTVATSLYTVVNSTDGDIVIFGAADNFLMRRRAILASVSQWLTLLQLRRPN